MVWLAIVTWVVVLALVLPAGGAMLPSLGFLVMVTAAGLATMVVFAVVGAHVWAWISFGLACVAAVVGIAGSRTLVYDDAQTLQGVPELVKNVAALSLGMVLPLIAATVLITLGTAAA
jgi:hypothetical protein